MNMNGPGWLAGIFAALMLTVAVYCAGRLIVARVWRRPTELDTDGGHVVMGVAMAGMLVSGLRTFPVSLWTGVFAAGAAWFGYHALRARRGAPASPWRCLQPAPHLVECAAMLYMLLAVRASAVFLPLLLAVFLLGWVIRLADRLTVRVPAFATAPGTPAPAPAPAPVPMAAAVPSGPLIPAQAPVISAQAPADDPAGGASAAPGRHGLPLAPRCATLCSMAMGITMGYMLITML
jgi:hypothetical protein